MATLCSSVVRVLPGIISGVTSSTLLCSSLIDLVSSVSTHKPECYHLPAATIFLLIAVLQKIKKKLLISMKSYSITHVITFSYVKI